MRRRSRITLCCALLALALNVASTRLYAQDSTEIRLKAHVYYLADDKLEGRATGSPGEKLASDYIIRQFLGIGLAPAGENGTYIQTFQAPDGYTPGKENAIRSENQSFTYPDVKPMYPLTHANNFSITANCVSAGYGIDAPSIGYDDYANVDASGKIVIIKFGSPDGDNPHSKYAEFSGDRDKVKTAREKGAVAVIFYAESTDNEPDINYKHNIGPSDIPVMYVSKPVEGAIAGKKEVTMQLDLTPNIRTGHNVIGYIDNHAKNTVVLGAHYDHLGYGEIEGSLYRGAPAIHNGADDNASGVSLIIELARKLKTDGPSQNNYLIIAFSGEEMGLIGSKAFTTSTLFGKYNLNYMFNFDMVGRMDSDKDLIINGIGTAPEWNYVDSLSIDEIHIKTSPSGIGPSDQTSFYLKDIPVLFFFTGSREDYHKPTDDADKVNYPGMRRVFDYVYSALDTLDTKGALHFTPSADTAEEDIPKFTVTLGVVPDYAFNGKGMRIDGVTEGKPAAHAGILAGDIVVGLGPYEVSDLYSYMRALGKFAKGDTTQVTIRRKDKIMKLPVQF